MSRVARTALALLILLAATGARGQYLSEVGRFTTGYFGDAVTLGHYVVAIQGDGLSVLDITDPTKPTLARQVSLAIQPMRLALNGSMACVVGAKGLQLIDLSDILNPRLRGFLPLATAQPVPYTSLDVAPGRAYIARDGLGLTIVDLSDPDRLATLGSYAAKELTKLYLVKARGDQVYLSDGGQQMLILDVSDPAAPAPRNKLAIGATAMVFDNNLAYATNAIIDPGQPSKRLGLQIFSLSDPTSPTLVGHYAIDGVNSQIPLDLALAGGRVYLADLAGGLLVFDVSTPAAPALLGSYREPHLQPLGISLAGTTACLVDGLLQTADDLPTNGIYLLDVSDPAHLRRTGAYLAAGEVRGLALDGSRLCLAHGDNGISMVDASDPTQPRIVGQCATPGTARGVALAGGLACVADGAHGLQVVDVSDPSSPTLKGAVALAGDAVAVTLAGTRAYVAETTAGLQIVDVTNPAAPVLLGGVGDGVTCRAVAVAAGRAYLATTAGLAIYDISDPAQPRKLGAYAMSVAATGVALDGTTAALTLGADPASGLPTALLLNVADPAAPTLLGRYQRPRTPWAQSVTLAGGLAGVVFNAGLTGRLSLIDTSHPTAPVPVAGMDFASGLNQVQLGGGLLYVATGTGLSILRYDPSQLALHLLAPNLGSLLGGSSIPLHWRTNVGVAGDTVRLQLVQDGVIVADLGTDQAAGGDHEPTLYLPPQLGDHDYRIRLSSIARPDLTVDSLDPLTVTGGPFRLVAPNGGETWAIGRTAQVEWVSNPVITGSGVKLLLYRGDQQVADLGTFWHADGHGIDTVQVPANLPPAADYSLHLVCAYSTNITDVSDGPITLAPPRNAVAPAAWQAYE